MQISFHKWAALLVFHALFTGAVWMVAIFFKCIFMNILVFPHVSYECAYIVWIAGTFRVVFFALLSKHAQWLMFIWVYAFNIECVDKEIIVKPCNQLNGPILRWAQTPAAEYSHHHFSIHFSIIDDGAQLPIATSTNQQRKSTRQ